MTEIELLGPNALGRVCGSAQLKATAEDFQVDEVLDIPLTGEGEHLWLWVEKRYLNTEEAAKRIAKAVKLPLRQVSYGGLKDKQALTRQWFSIHLPGKTDPDLSMLESDQLHVIKKLRHQRKLQRGTHSGNGFIIRLTNLQADKKLLEERLAQITLKGVPNYFGPQRFGFNGNNIEQALVFANQHQYPEQRNIRSRLLSSARSYLFNKVLAARVLDSSWDKVVEGDIISFTESRSFFSAEQLTRDDHRLLALMIHPTGPLVGEGEPLTSALMGDFEQTVLADESLLVGWLQAAGLRQERRILRLPVIALAWDFIGIDQLQLSFTLPTGCFATSVIKELVTLQVDDKCIF